MLLISLSRRIEEIYSHGERLARGTPARRWMEFEVEEL